MLDKNKWVKVAAIDIGSNSVRLLIALVDATGKTEPLCTHLATTRLGEGIQAGLLLAEAMERTVKAIQQFIVLIESYDVQQEHILLCATSAVRDALNQHDFLQLVQLRTGFTVKVLSGQEEAFWGYYGVSRNTKLADAYPVVVDVGGGSTEFIWFEKEVLACVSTQVGACLLYTSRCV